MTIVRFRNVSRIVLLAAATCVAAGAAPAQLETIDSTYWNVRGFDYVATYRDIHAVLGVPATVPISDVASPVAMWHGFDPGGATGAQVQAQLRRIKQIGANTVRVWLSYHLYYFRPADARSRFDAFLTFCDTIGLHVIAVLWDNDFEEPDYTSVAGRAYANFMAWVRSPGTERLESRAGQLDASMTAFVNDMVTIGSRQASLLMWNAMNEPVFGAATHQDEFVANTLRAVKSRDPDAVTSVSPATWLLTGPDAAAYAAVANDSRLDVLGAHNYGYFTADVEGACYNARNAARRYKPIVIDEAGFVGNGAAYPETLNRLSRVPATFTGNPRHARGVGFCLFQAYVGNFPTYATGQHPFVLGNGLLYSPEWDNGATKYVRDYTNPGAVASLVAVAALHGVTVAPPALTPMPATHPGYVPQLPLPEGLHRPELDILFRHWMPTFDSVRHVDFAAAILTGVSAFSFALFPSYGTNVRVLIPPDHLEDMVDAYLYYTAWRSRVAPDPADPQLQLHVLTWWVETSYYWQQLLGTYP